jgi:uncharacterized protein YbjT (DUF2867 family)
MKVLVTGATGFTGSYVVPRLLAKNYQVRCLVRPESRLDVIPRDRVELAQGDLEDVQALVAALQGVDALVNVASIGFGHAPGIITALQQAGVRRAVFTSTTALFTTLNASSKTRRLAAEEAIRESGLEYTIVRPTMIYGSSRDRNMCRLVKLLKRTPIFPIVGDGKSWQQPVYVDNVAGALVDVLEFSATIGQAYNVSGAQRLTYNDVVDTTCAALGRRVRKLHLPVKPIVAALSTLERTKLRLPIKAEQILRLNENKAFNHDAAARDFNYQPLSFAEGMRLEIEEMRRVGALA